MSHRIRQTRAQLPMAITLVLATSAILANPAAAQTVEMEPAFDAFASAAEQAGDPEVRSRPW